MELAPPQRWSRVEDLFARAMDLSPAERAVLLESTRSVDEGLHRDLSRLLAAHETAGAFLESLDGVRVAELLRPRDGSPADPEVIGPYRVVRRLGRGGMGVVHLAHDPRLDRPVALKLLRPHLTVDGRARRRLLREARAASALDHPNIATVYEVGDAPDGRVFIAMAYCPGESLAERIARGPLGPREAAGLARQLAEGLAAAHRRGIVHRDVKPGNLLVSDDGRLRIVDFGVARIAGDAAGSAEAEGNERAGPDETLPDGPATHAPRPGGATPVVGTLAYMSPEQVRGEPVGPGADLWALGVVLHEMLTGRRPFEGDRRILAAEVLGGDPPPLGPSVPAPLARLVEACLRKEPFERPADAREVAGALTDFLDGEASPRRSRRVWPNVGGLVAAATVAGIVAAAVLGLPPFGGPDVRSDAAPGALAVFPLTPVTADTALDRLGRELVVTLSATLDGVGGVRTADPMALLGQPVPESGWSDAEAVRIARAMSAASILRGTLTRSGPGVRLDLELQDVDDPATSTRTTIDVPVLDVAAVHEAASLALVRELGGGRQAPDPAALRTSSVAALKAYLEGELAIAGGRFRSAPEAFLRATREDSTFWYAYWRYAYARSYHGLPVDSAIGQAVLEHRTAFPEPDRLMVEARLADSLSVRIERLRTITGRFPTYVPAWFELGDQLVHHGPYLGVSARETALVLDRVVELQPSFVPALEHGLWAAALVLDTVRTGRNLDRLVELRFDTLVQTEWDLETLGLYRYLDHLARTGDEPSVELAEVGVTMMERFAGPYDPERIAPSLTKYGFHRAQLDIGRRIAASSASPDVKAAYRWASALAWAGRGGWDSTVAVARDYARATTAPRGPLHAYGLVAAGAWLGAVHPDSTDGMRELAAASPEARTADGRAELEWLGGLVACARGDRAALEAHRRSVGASGGPHAARLESTLRAFGVDLAGRGVEAAESLAALQWDDAEVAAHFGTGHLHPFLGPVERLAGARGLLAAGDSTGAARLLVWHEADLPGSLYPLPSANIVVGAAALPLLASLHEARGFPEVAGAHRSIFRLRHDLAPEAAPRLVRGLCGGD